MSLGAWDDTDARTADARREMAQRQRQRERVENAADRLAQMERELRLECRKQIHETDRILRAPQPWDEAQWQRATAASVLQDDYLLPAYSLLSFGAIAERTLYVLADRRVRVGMAAAVREAGGVRTDSGHWQGVVE